MNIIEIYNKYHLPENLQMHMLRVATCSKMIIDNWNGPKIDKKSIIRVSLLHDMGNILEMKILKELERNILISMEQMTMKSILKLENKKD